MNKRQGLMPTVLLLAGALYTLFPIAWIVAASTKTTGELFTAAPFALGSAFFANIAELSSYEDGVYWQWSLNSLIFAGGGAIGATFISAAAGYAIARFSFRGKRVVLLALLGSVMVPMVVLAIPQYLLMSQIGLSNTYFAVLLPSLISPFSIYLCSVYTQSAVHEDLLEAARIDGAGEAKIFFSIALPMLVPGLVTVFMLQFVAIWNNFLLPFIMLSDESKYPLTTGLYLLLSRGSGSPALYSLAITGALISIVPLCLLMIILQRYWRMDLVSGAIKG